MRQSSSLRQRSTIRWGRAVSLAPAGVLSLVWALTGCYVYQPLGAAEPEVGSRVAAELTEAGTDTLARAVGPQVVELRGSITGVQDQSLILALSSVSDRTGRVTTWAGEQVVVPVLAVRTLAAKRLSAGRTVLLGIACVAGSVILLDAFEGMMAGGSGGGRTPGGEPQ